MLFVTMAGAGAFVTAIMIWAVLALASLLRKISRQPAGSESEWVQQIDLPEVRATVAPPQQNDGRGFQLW